MTNLKRSRKALKLKDIFPEGVPRGKELKNLKRAFSGGFSRTKRWYKENESQLGESSSTDPEGLSAAPFVDTDTIKSATSYINKVGDQLASALTILDSLIHLIKARLYYNNVGKFVSI